MIQERKILIVDDEELIRKVLDVKIRDIGYRTLLASDGEEAKKFLKENKVDMVFCDVFMPSINGFEMLKYIKENYEDIIVIIMTAYANLKTAIKAFDFGAFDYLIKPFTMEEIPFLINRALVFKDLLARHKEVKQEGGQTVFSELIGISDYIRGVREKLARMAHDPLPVLISGPAGTGKKFMAKLIARYFQENKNADFYFLNPLSHTTSIEEAVRSIFTVSTELGRRVHTVIIDHGDSLPFSLQETVAHSCPKDLKCIFLSDKQIDPENYKKYFSEELFSLLSERIVKTIPLRDHREDIPLFLRYFLDQYNQKYGKKVKDFEKDAFSYLLYYSWPENIREMEYVMEQVVMLSKGSLAGMETLREFLKEQEDMRLIILNPRLRYKDALKMSHKLVDRYYVRSALKVTQNNKTKAARLLGISLRQFQYQCRDLEL